MTSIFRSTVETLDWRGMLVQVSYNPNWSGMSLIAHLEIETQEPVRAPLPMTETGYRSHFIGQGIVEEAGGPAAYVWAWLEDAAKHKGWAIIDAEARQLALF
jgi:hypothetical protein